MKHFGAAALLAVLIAAAAPAVRADSAPQFSTLADFQNADNYTVFNALLRTTGLLDQLESGIDNLTIFAPTDDAFQNLATTQSTELIPLLAGSNIADVLKYHVVNSSISAMNLYDSEQLSTLLGQDQKLTIQGSGPAMTLAIVGGSSSNVAGFQNYNIGVGKGYIQGITSVLIPPTSTSDDSTA